MGEASHPGPLFTVLSENVSSYLAHVDYLGSQVADVQPMQEVRLTDDGQIIADSELKRYNRTWMHGKPQPVRNGTTMSTTDAKQGGVGTTIHTLHQACPTCRTEVGDALHETGRWQSSTIRLFGGDSLFHVVNGYGYPRANEGGEAMETNEAFLADILAEASSLGESDESVPVVICLDANVTPEKSHVLSQAHVNGTWTDAAKAIATLSGDDPADTYTSGGTSSRIDCILLNRAAMQILKSFRVLDVPENGIKSHRPLEVVFDVTIDTTHAWKIQQPNAYPEIEKLPKEDEDFLCSDVLERFSTAFYHALEHGTIDEVYITWCQLAETYLNERAAWGGGHTSILNSPQYKGRGTSAKAEKVKVERRPHDGDGVSLDPEKTGILDLRGLIQCAKDFAPTHSDLEMRVLWRQIVSCGKQFLKSGKFKKWWQEDHMPAAWEWGFVLTAVDEIIARMARNRRQKTINRWRSTRNGLAQRKPGSLFKGFRESESAPLTVLMRDDGSITGNVEEMDELLREAWLPIFAKHADGTIPEPSAADFMQAYRNFIPNCPMTMGALTLKDLQTTIGKMCACGAGGLDGWRPGDFKNLPADILELLLLIYDRIEADGIWPEPVSWAGISLIPKGEGGKPLQLRPITVTSVVYRLWAASRMRQCNEWQTEWLAKGQHGARSHHGTMDALVRISLAFEQAALDGTPLHGVAVDLSKAFDNVPVEIVFAIMRELGMDERVCRPLRAMYHQIQRRFKISGFVGDAFRSTNGILQGCPLSVMLLNAIMMVATAALGADVEGESYVDDLTLLSTNPEKLQSALDNLGSFMAISAQQINHKKTVSFGARSSEKFSVGGIDLEHKTETKILGQVIDTSDGTISLKIPEKKIENGVKMCHRIRYAGLPFHLRSMLCGAMVLSKALYGVEVADLHRDQERRLRSSIVSAVWQKRGRDRAPGLLLTLPVKGHVVDPAQAPHVNRLLCLQRVVANDPEVALRIFTILEDTSRRRIRRGGGFVSNLRVSLKRLGLNRVPGCLAFRSSTQKPMYPLSTRKSVWQHEVREAARRMVWNQVAKERNAGGDLAGIEKGIQKEVTMILHQTVCPREAGILRKILLGAVWTQKRRSKLPSNEDGPRCQHCDLGVEEDLVHLWWRCPAWNHLRGDLTCVENWPTCFKTSGIVPNGVKLSSEVVGKVQSVMLSIFGMRYEGFSRNT